MQLELVRKMIQFTEDHVSEVYPSDDTIGWEMVQDGVFWEYLKGSVAATSYNINSTY